MCPPDVFSASKTNPTEKWKGLRCLCHDFWCLVQGRSGEKLTNSNNGQNQWVMGRMETRCFPRPPWRFSLCVWISLHQLQIGTSAGLVAGLACVTSTAVGFAAPALSCAASSGSLEIMQGMITTNFAGSEFLGIVLLTLHTWMQEPLYFISLGFWGDQICVLVAVEAGNGQILKMWVECPFCRQETSPFG